MLHLVRPNRAYDPETVAAMTAAFDRVCQSGSQWINGNDNVKQTLVLIILRHGDRGERDPQRFADVALREWTSADIPQRERSRLLIQSPEYPPMMGRISPVM
jgi:hypothetical protein